AHLLSALGAILGEIVAPDMIGVLRPPSDLAFLTVAPLDGLTPGQLQSFLPPQPLNPLVIDLMPIPLHQRCDVPVAVLRVTLGGVSNCRRHCSLLGSASLLVTER